MPNTTVRGLDAFYVHKASASRSQAGGLRTRPPVVFVHGAGGTHRHWLHQVRDLTRGAPYAVDLPGHGRSQGPGCDAISAYGDWLVAFLDACGLDRAVLVGHSMGGGIVQEVALCHPDRVSALGLVGTGARLRVAPAILDAIRKDYPAAVVQICEWAFGPQAPAETMRLARAQMEAVPAEVTYGDFMACNGFDVMDRVEAIGVPVLVLCGEQDRLTPPKYSTHLRDRIPGACLRFVEGSGHNVMIERPQVVTQALDAFLEDISRV